MAAPRLKIVLSAPRQKFEEIISLIDASCDVITASPQLTGQLIKHEAKSGRIDGVLIFAEDTTEDTIALAKQIDAHGISYMLALKQCTSAQVLFELPSREFILVSRDAFEIKAIITRFLLFLESSSPPLQRSSASAPQLPGDIWVRQGYADRRVSLNDIRSITAEKDYVIIELPSSSLLVRATLTALEDELKAQGFIRIHRSHIIPVSRIREVKNSTRHSHQIELDDGAVFPVGKTYWPRLRTRFRGQALRYAG